MVEKEGNKKTETKNKRSNEKVMNKKKGGFAVHQVKGKRRVVREDGSVEYVKERSFCIIRIF